MADLVEDPVRRQRYRFSRDGDVLRIEIWVDPGGEVPKHLHPSHEERFHVLEGEVRFTLDRETQVAGPGDRLVVPVGAIHRYENIGQETARMVAEAEPALQMQELLEEAAALARAGKLTRRGLPKSPRAALELAEFADRYRDTVVVMSPPRLLQRLIGGPLARLERRLRPRGAGSSGG